MDYSQMLTQVEDSEINIRVGELFGWNAYFIHQDGSVTFRDDKGRIKGKKNYCKNPADAYPIITENRIAIIPDTAVGEWVAFNEFTLYEGDWMFASDPTYHSNGKNPLRCAMECFLLMQDSKHG